MGRIFLIENSLVGTGTHHYDLAECLVQAAQELGFEVMVGAHRSAPEKDLQTFSCPVRRVFSSTVYQRCSALAGLRQAKRFRSGDGIVRPTSSGTWGRIAGWWHDQRLERQRERNVFRFAQDCATFFDGVELREQDRVVFGTVGDQELLGALHFLSQTPRTMAAQWNFVFHFPIFSGRPENYPAQIRALLPLQNRIARELTSLPYHRLQFFATTAGLVEQYSRWGIPDVRLFDYPVAREFSTCDPALEERELWDERVQFLVAGGVRREKGQSALLSALGRQADRFNHLAPRIRLAIQTPRRPAWQKQKLTVTEALDSSALQMVPHPLPKEDYVRLIHSADCGILMYDRNNYFCRRAGILGEFFAAGKPVIASAGSWLGDQLDEPCQLHAESMLRNYPVLNEINPGDLDWNPRNVPQSGNVWSFDGGSHPFDVGFTLQDQTGGLVLEFQWHYPQGYGYHCQWDLLVGQQRKSLSRVFASGRPGRSQFAFFPTGFRPRQVRLELRNPTAQGTQSIHRVRIYELGREARYEPIGAAGVSLLNLDQLPEALAEVSQHCEHYRLTAEAFGREWVHRHLPVNALRAVLATPRRKQKTA